MNALLSTPKSSRAAARHEPGTYTPAAADTADQQKHLEGDVAAAIELFETAVTLGHPTAAREVSNSDRT